MLLLSFKASDEVMVLYSSVMSKILGYLNTSSRLSSSPTSVRNILRLQVFWDGSHSACVESWLLVMYPVVKVLFSSRNNCTGVVV